MRKVDVETGSENRGEGRQGSAEPVASPREELGVEIGDVVSVVLQRDVTERKVVVPVELQRTLAADPVARRTFASNSTSHQREFAEWVAEAKRPETRERRAAKAVEMLRAGQKRS